MDRKTFSVARFESCGSVAIAVGLGLLSAVSAFCPVIGQDGTMVLKRENFDRDPGWEGFNNRLAEGKLRRVTQDFGFSQTNFTGAGRGEVGGQITRAARLAYYGAPLKPVTLEQKLTATGTFVLETTEGSGGAFVGWFFHVQPDTGRPTSSLGLNIDTEGSGGRLAIRLISSNNLSCGQFVTHFTPGGHRPTPLRPHVRYGFTLTYDPASDTGRGRVEFTLTGQGPTDEIDSPISFELPENVRKDGATFDRFGIANMRKAGGAISLYLSDVRVNDQHWDFATDPTWDAHDNRLTYDDRELAGAHDFGFCKTKSAGGQPGEIGGAVWRTDDNWAWYADRVGPLSLGRPLHAGGKIAFTGGDPDSGVLIGWFSSSLKNDGPQGGRPPPLHNFVGVHLEGPTRIGHYFRPAVFSSRGQHAEPDQGPIFVPDSRPHTWSLDYDPTTADGRGLIRVTLDNELVTFELPAGLKSEGTTFDRFGFLNVRSGGGRVKVFLDDLEYSSSTGRP